MEEEEEAKQNNQKEEKGEAEDEDKGVDIKRLRRGGKRKRRQEKMRGSKTETKISIRKTGMRDEEEKEKMGNVREENEGAEVSTVNNVIRNSKKVTSRGK